jgi:hypothetical protein
MKLLLLAEVSSNIWSKTFSKEKCAANPFFLALATFARTRDGFVKFSGEISGVAESGSNEEEEGLVGYY